MLKSRNYTKILLSFGLAIVLSACGGGSGADFGPGDGDGSGSGNGGGNDGSGDSKFQLSKLAVGLTDLAAGASTGVTVELRENGSLAQTSQTITFSSPCVANGTSTIDTPVTSTNGVFTTTYTAIGCEGSDVITAKFNDQTASATVNVQPANLGAVEFISAEPETILLKGMSAPGKQLTSKVTFKVKNDVGGPIPNANVLFELTTDVGGIKLSVTEAKSDNNGLVSTILQSGTVHTSVRVRAIVERNGVSIASESSQLIISTGVADQNSMSLSLSELNPAAWDHDGVQVDVNIYAADRYNNPVPDGTTVSFYTELGQIQPSCQTTEGSCSVKWTSSEPRDLGTIDPLYPRDASTKISDGITTITAVVIGEESFIDTNSNGYFDDGDQLDSISDKGEAFEDYNMSYDTDTPRDNVSNNAYDQGLEPYLDFNRNGIRDPKDGKYTGLGCQHSTLCANDGGLKNIFKSIELVLAEDNQDIRIWQNGAPLPSGTSIANGAYKVQIFGIRNKQVPPVGTTVKIESDEAKIIVGESATIGNTTSHGNNLTDLSTSGYFMDLVVGPGSSASGSVKINIKTPKGVDRTIFYPYDSN